MGDYAKWYVRSAGGRLLSRTKSDTKDEALRKFLAGKRRPVWIPWFRKGYRLAQVTITIGALT